MDAYLASLVSVIGINMILALSLTIITGFCGQVSLGHAAFYGIGAYTAAYLAKLGARSIAVASAFAIAELRMPKLMKDSIPSRHRYSDLKKS